MGDFGAPDDAPIARLHDPQHAAAAGHAGAAEHHGHAVAVAARADEVEALIGEAPALGPLEGPRHHGAGDVSDHEVARHDGARGEGGGDAADDGAGAEVDDHEALRGVIGDDGRDRGKVARRRDAQSVGDGGEDHRVGGGSAQREGAARDAAGAAEAEGGEDEGEGEALHWILEMALRAASMAGVGRPRCSSAKWVSSSRACGVAMPAMACTRRTFSGLGRSVRRSAAS